MEEITKDQRESLNKLLHDAARNGNPDAIKALHTLGANVNAQDDPDALCHRKQQS